MVKRQFEVGRERLGAGGVVRDLAHRAGAVAEVVRACRSTGVGSGGRHRLAVNRAERQCGVLRAPATRRTDRRVGRRVRPAGYRRGSRQGRLMTLRRMLLVAHTCRPDIAITACAAAARLAEAGIELLALAGEGGELNLAVFDPADTGRFHRDRAGDRRRRHAAARRRTRQAAERSGPGHRPGSGRVPHRGRPGLDED